MESCLYLHINPVKNHVFYVGIGNKKRPFDKTNRSEIWKRTVAKYGIVVNVLENNLTWTEAQEKERSLIKEIGRKNLGNGTLVNLTDGGDGAWGYRQSDEMKEKRRIMRTGIPMSEETKKRISLGNKGKLKGRDPWNKGVEMSEELRDTLNPYKRTQSHKDQVSQRHKGKKMSDEAKFKISEYNKGKICSTESKIKSSINSHWKNKDCNCVRCKLKTKL